jgi:hypothetical protein
LDIGHFRLHTTTTTTTTTRITTMAIMWRPIVAALVLSFAALVGGAPSPLTNKSTERPIKIINESGGKVEVYWIHPQTGEGSLMTTPSILHGAVFTLNSFISHKFQAREVPSEKTGHCKSKDKICKKADFVVSANSDQGKSCKYLWGVCVRFRVI